MSVYLIASMSKDGVIGVENRLPWDIPLDLKWFKMNTTEGAVIMGRKTWESLPIHPLPNRKNIVVSRHRNSTDSTSGEYWCNTITEAMQIAGESSTYIIGGGEIFHSAQLLQLVDHFILTHVDTTFDSKYLTTLSVPIDRKIIWTSPTLVQNGLSFHFELSTLKK